MRQNILSNLIKILERKEKISLIFIFFFILTLGFVETLGIAILLPLLDFIVFEAKKDNSDKFPIAGQYRYNNIPNDHLQYALTWFSLAIVLFIIMRIFWNKHLNK